MRNGYIQSAPIFNISEEKYNLNVIMKENSAYIEKKESTKKAPRVKNLHMKQAAKIWPQWQSVSRRHRCAENNAAAAKSGKSAENCRLGKQHRNSGQSLGETSTACEKQHRQRRWRRNLARANESESVAHRLENEKRIENTEKPAKCGGENMLAAKMPAKRQRTSGMAVAYGAS